MNRAQATVHVLTTRTEAEITKLVEQVVREEAQLRQLTLRISAVVIDHRALERLLDCGVEGGAATALAHELADVCELEVRLRGRCEKLERDLVDLRGRLARWETLRKHFA